MANDGNSRTSVPARRTSIGVTTTLWSLAVPSSVLTILLLLTAPSYAAAIGQVDIVGPPGSVEFGKTVTALPNGNLVITERGATDMGAVYLYRPDGTRISTLTGSTAGDQIGSNFQTPVGDLRSIVVLGSGNYLIVSPYWNNASGAVTWGSATTGVSGVVSAANSLVGTTAGSYVGSNGVTVLSNGNYVVRSPYWYNGRVSRAGAATWGNGNSGTFGAVSTANSLVGSTQGDEVAGFTLGTTADDQPIYGVNAKRGAPRNRRVARIAPHRAQSVHYQPNCAIAGQVINGWQAGARDAGPFESSASNRRDY